MNDDLATPGRSPSAEPPVMPPPPPPPIHVTKVAQYHPLTDGTCQTCGGHLLYNLTISLIDHDPPVPTCTEPWPAKPTAS